MKKISVTGLILLLGLAACAPYMYGVPQESWDRMSQPERIEAMRVYDRNEQARRLAAEDREHQRLIEEQARRQAAEERARREAREREEARVREAALERERRERIEVTPVVIREREHRAPIALTAPFIGGKTLRWETDALGGQTGTLYVTSTNGKRFYLDQKNHKNAAAGITKLEGEIKDGQIVIKNSKWGETWIGTLRNGTVSGKINNKFTFRITE